MNTATLGALLAALLLVGPAAAQNCGALLPDGVLDRADVINTLALVARVGTWFCGQRFATYEDATAPGRAARLPVSELLAPFGLTRDRQSFPAAYQAFCGRAATDRVLKAGSLAPFIAANKGLVSAYLACLHRGGAEAYVEAAHDPWQFSLVIQWSALGATAAPRIEAIAATQDDGKPLACSPALPAQGAALDRGERRYLCSRDPTQAARVTVVLSSAASTLTLAPFARYRLIRDEVSGDSETALAAAGGGDGLPVCVGAPGGNADDSEYLIDYRKTTGVPVGDGAAALGSSSWRLSTKEPKRVCLIAHGSEAATAGTSVAAYRIHYVFYRYRLEKTHRFSLPTAAHAAPKRDK